MSATKPRNRRLEAAKAASAASRDQVLGTTFSTGGYRYVIGRLVPTVHLRCTCESTGTVSEVTTQGDEGPDQFYEAMLAARARVEEIKRKERTR